MGLDVAARHPRATLTVALVVLLGCALGALRLEPQVDFVDTVPASASVDAYRDLLGELDGTRFVAVHMPAKPGADLQSDADFDALVLEQEALTNHLATTMPGTFSHSLSVYEAMRAGNRMFMQVVTAGNAPDSSYALPSDPVAHSYVRNEVRGESGKDVLAESGASALALFFLAAKDDATARQDAGRAAEAVDDWHAGTTDGRVTDEPQVSGLPYSSHYTDERNRDDLRLWGAISVAAAALSVLVVVRRAGDAVVAGLSLALATAAAFGLAGWLGLKVSFLTVFLAPIVTGIGMDYALHLLRRHEEEAAQGRPSRQGMATALRRIGPALIASAAATTLGLAVLLLLPAPLFAQVGALGAIGLAMALVASLTFAPALRSLMPSRPVRRPDRIGAAMARAADRVAAHPVASLVAVALLVAAGAVGATRVQVASGSAENEFPQDDPVIALQHRIESEYGAFQRAYLVVQGDIARPEALRGLLDATGRAATLPLFREAASVADLVVADAATDEGALDILASQVQPMADEDRLPTDPPAARRALDDLFADPLWRTLAPFVVSRDYDLAVVAIQVEPWTSQGDLDALAAALERQADALGNQLGPNYDVQAAGAPLNRAAVAHGTPRDVTVAILGTGVVVAAVLGLAWVRRGAWGTLAAATGVVVVLGAALLLLASVPALDGLYRAGEDNLGWAANRAPLTNMFLLAFAVTVAVGADGFVQLLHRAWQERDLGKPRRRAVHDAFLATGRSVFGTFVTTVAAFTPLAGLYFLQSKNLAILAALGALYAFALTMLLAPLVAARGRARTVDGRGAA